MSADRKYWLAAQQIASISHWVDTSPKNIGRNREALGWHRVGKPVEEAGEAWGAWLLYCEGNPRKPKGPIEDVIEELLDTANAALAAVEHLTGNEGRALDMLVDKVERVWIRAQAVDL